MQMLGVSDPELTFNTSGDREVRIGPKDFNIESREADSVSMPGQTTWNFSPASVTTVVSRQVWIEALIRINFTSTPVANGRHTLYIGTDDAPAFMPLAQLTDNMSVQINGQSLTLDTKEIIDLFAWIGDDEFKYDFMLKGTPSARDAHQQFGDAGANQANNPAQPAYLPNRALTVNDPIPLSADNPQIRNSGPMFDPMGCYGTYCGKGTPRGSCSIVEKVDATVNNTNAGKQSYVVIKVREPLILPPFNVNRDASGLIGITNFNVQLTSSGTAYRAWTRKRAAFGGHITAMSAQFVGKPKINFLTYTPPVIQKIPMQVFYDYPNIYRNENQITTDIVRGETRRDVTTGTLQLSAIPEYIIIQVKKSSRVWSSVPGDPVADEYLNPWHNPNTFARILKVRVSFGDKQNLLASMTSYELWNLSTKAGLDMTWDQWYITTGGMLILKLGDAIPLEPGICPGLQIRTTFQAFLDVQDLRGAPGLGGEDMPYSCVVTTVTPGQMSITNQKVDITSNLFNTQTAFFAQNLAVNGYARPFKDNRPLTMFGGNLINKLGKQIMKHGTQFIKDGGVGKVINQVSKHTGIPVPPVLNTALRLSGLSKKGGAIASSSSLQKRAKVMEEEYEYDE